MVERVSALKGHYTPGDKGLLGPDGPGVILTERRPVSIWLIAAWPDRLRQTGAVAAEAAGVPMAPGPGRAVTGSAGLLMRTEPLKCLFVSDRETPRPPVAAEYGTVVDLGHARTVIRVEGPNWRDLMARMVPLDLREQTFPVDAVAASGLHHMGVTLHRFGNGVDVYALRSFGLAVWEHLVHSAEQFGVRIS